MPGIIHLSKVKPEMPVTILVSRLAAVREIRTEARHSAAIVADYAHRNDVYRVTARAGRLVETVPGPLAREAVTP